MRITNFLLTTTLLTTLTGCSVLDMEWGGWRSLIPSVGHSAKQDSHNPQGVTRIMRIAGRQVRCKHSNHSCLLVKTGQQNDWTVFEGSIEGFVYKDGFEYMLEVKEIPASQAAALPQAVEQKAKSLTDKAEADKTTTEDAVKETAKETAKAVAKETAETAEKVAQQSAKPAQQTAKPVAKPMGASRFVLVNQIMKAPAVN